MRGTDALVLKKQLSMKIIKNTTGRFILLLITISGLALTSCSTTPKNRNNDQSESLIEMESSSVPQQRDEVRFMDSQGKTVSLGDLKGKVIFLNFWATWCPPCIAEMPSINKLRQSLKDEQDIVFMLVDVDNNLKKSTAFMKKKKYDLPVYAPASAIPSTFLEGAIPTTVIIDKKGEIIARIEGGRDYSSPGMLKSLNQLIHGK